MLGIIEKVVAFDDLVASGLGSLHRPWLATFFQTFTPMGSAYFCYPAYGVGIIWGPSSVAGLIIAVLITEIVLFPILVILRYATVRRRPVDRATRKWEPWNKYSFPSFHAARICMLATFIAAYSPRLLPVAGNIALLVSFSRLYLHRHYFSDVIAGGLMGVLSALAFMSFAWEALPDR